MSDILIELANEYRRLQRQLESKTQQLDALLRVNAEAGDFPTDFDGVRNRRYSIEMSFEAGSLEPQESSVQVEKGTIFRCAAVESFVRAIGTAGDPYTGDDATVQATLPWDQRFISFDFLWRLRDTGTDREWTDQPQPALFLGGGYTEPLWLPRRTILGGGTKIFANVDPFQSVTDDTSSFFQGGGSVERYLVQISFIGHDVPDGSPL